MKNIYELIETQALDENTLVDLMVEGFDLNDESDLEFNDEEITPLIAAVNSGNVEVVRLLLDFGAENIYTVANGGTALWNAYRAGNVEMLMLLIKKIVQLKERAAKKEGDTQIGPKGIPDFFYSSGNVKWFVLDSVHTDQTLHHYPEIKKFLSEMKIVQAGMDMSGGNADDKVECTIIDLGFNRGRLEYYFQTNWSYCEENVLVKWIQNENEEIIVKWNTDDQDAIQVSHLKGIQKLSIALGLGNVPVKTVLAFFTLLLSYMVQTDHLFDDGWEGHPFFDYLADEVVTNKELLELPIEKLSCGQYALDV